MGSKARGIITRNLVTGEIERHAAHAVVIASGGLWKSFLSVNQCHGKQRNRCLENPQARRLFCESVLYTNPPDLYSRFGRPPVQTHPDVGVFAK